MASPLYTAMKGRKPAALLILVAAILLDHTVSQTFHGGNSHHGNYHNHNRNVNQAHGYTRKEDPYTILGVSPKASHSEIQKAYRQKARETHPDKQNTATGGGKKSTEEVIEEFRCVADAFDVLGDAQKRKSYDDSKNREAVQEQYRRDQERRRNEQQRQQRERVKREQREREQRAERDRMKRNREKAKRAAELLASGKMAKVASLEDLGELGVLTSNYVYGANFLCVFVGNKGAEKIADEDYAFPHSFADEEWGGIVQTAKVRYNKETPITKLYRASLNSNQPLVIFARQGDRSTKFDVFTPTGRFGNPAIELEQWVEERLAVTITITNRHSSPVELFVSTKRSAGNRRVWNPFKAILDPNYETTITARYGDRIVALDVRTDRFPGSNAPPARTTEQLNAADGAFLFDETMTTATSSGERKIREQRCFDLSIRCSEWTRPSWDRRDLCVEHAEFMHHMCAASCGTCAEPWYSVIGWRDVVDLPLGVLSFIGDGIQTMVEDAMYNVKALKFDIKLWYQLRKTASVVFILVGILLMVDAAAWKMWWLRIQDCGSRWNRDVRAPMQITDFAVLTGNGVLATAAYWLFSFPLSQLPYALRPSRIDLMYIITNSFACAGLLGVGMVVFTLTPSKNFSVVFILVGIILMVDEDAWKKWWIRIQDCGSRTRNMATRVKRLTSTLLQLMAHKQ